MATLVLPKSEHFAKKIVFADENKETSWSNTDFETLPTIVYAF